YCGAVITQAASGDPQVKALVYVAAFAPTRGERLNQLLMRRVAHPIAPLPLVSIKALLDAETLDAVDAYAAAGAHTHAGEPGPADAVDPRAPSRGVTDLSPL
ncbi:MAG: alpha/beta hydrolase, partial [Solirubrobacteraceae bacterium]